MAVSSFGAAVSGGGSALPPNALEKVFETYSPDGYMSYSPEGGLEAGTYVVEAYGSGVDYLDVVAPGVAKKGPGNFSYVTTAGGGELTATATTFGDPTVFMDTKQYDPPLFRVENSQPLPTYSFVQSTPYYWSSTHGLFASIGSGSNNRNYWSGNLSSYQIVRSATSIQGWYHFGDTTSRGQIGDVVSDGVYLYAQHDGMSGGPLYRTTDLSGKTGWQVANGNFNGLKLHATNSGRLLSARWGEMWYSDNRGTSWTQATSTGGRVFVNIFEKPNGTLFAFATNGFYSGGQLSYIYRSTNNGSSWTQISTFSGSTSHVIVDAAYSPTLDRWLIVYQNKDQGNYPWMVSSDDDFATYNSGFDNVSYRLTTSTTGSLSVRVEWMGGSVNRFVIGLNNGQIRSTATGLDTTTNTTFERNAPNAQPFAGFKVYEDTLFYLCSGTLAPIGYTSDLNTFYDNASAWSNPNGIAFANGNYVLTNNTTTILRGPSLGDLSAVTISVSPIEVVGGNGKFMARDTSNRVLSSTDGITWTLAPTANAIYSVPCFVDGKFIRMDTNRVVWTSLDAVTWTQHGSTTYLYRKFKKIGNTYYAFADTNGTYGYSISSDLLTWRISNTGSSTSLRNIEYSEAIGQYVYQRWNWYLASAKALGESAPDSNSEGWEITRGITGTTAVNTNSGIDIGFVNPNGTVGASNTYLFESTWPSSAFYSPIVKAARVNNGTVGPIGDSNYQPEPAVGRGKVASVWVSLNRFYEFSYGKPAGFAVYKVKE